MSTAALDSSRAPSGPGFAQLSWAYTSSLVRERLRSPAAVIPNVLFPTLVFLFFVLPQSGLTSDPMLSVTAITQLATFAVMSSLLFGYGITVADDRQSPWTSYLRTLPVGAAPGLIARTLAALLFCALALLPLLVVSACTTAAPQAFVSGALPWWRLPVGLLVTLLVGLPFLGIGLIIGYLCSSKAAVAVVQVVFFPLAFAGGMMLPPQMFPSWLNTISAFLPSREARDLAISVTTGSGFSWSTLLLWAAWTVVLFLVAAILHSRDQGQRFS